MWCHQCQAEVATEIAADGQSLLCTSCGGEVRKVFAPSLHPETRSARELLERWAAAELLNEAGDETPLDPPEPAPPRPSSPAPRSRPESDSPRPRAERPAPPSKSKPKFRIDAAHSTGDVVERPRVEETTPHARPAASRPRREAAVLPAGYRQDEAHATLKGPHFPVGAPLETGPAAGHSESLWGQMLAYLGVGVLTIGTVLVLWGHFGHLPNYASSGWLVATAGQMLLFLGVVTLISGGMQQTTHEVTRRVEHIGDRIIRIEQSAREFWGGPHFDDARRGAREEAAAATDSRRSADE